MGNDLDLLTIAYYRKKDKIQKRLSEFKGVLDESDERFFAELAFCLCTPQSKATTCWEVVSSLMRSRLLFEGSEEQIRPFLNAIRFGYNKARYIVNARSFFTKDGNLRIKERVMSFNDPFSLREWLVNNVLGMGMKEASHFLRNIGLGSNLAILDRHILKNLKKHGVIEEVPKSMTRKAYLDTEKKMRDFSNRIDIPMDELDLLFWSEETGMVFK
ncbi:MAG: N-glycosylase/DNA lyase [Nitrososphaerales archaeon]|nr:N-glycosylase/DNA lyase [Nitrososphaerales archaeon]